MPDAVLSLCHLYVIEFISVNPRNSVSQYDNPHFLDNEMKSRKESSGSHSQQERRKCVLERNRKEELVWGKIILSSILDMFALFCFQLF